MSEVTLTADGRAGEQRDSTYLRRAAERVLEAGYPEPPGGISSVLGQLVEAVERVQGGAESHLDPEEIELPHLHHRLLEALRHEILRWWSDEGFLVQDVAAADVLETLSALERVRLGLWPEGAQDLVSRLSEPDAYELLVEVAHDLRSPLSSILFLAETLRSEHSGPVTGLQKSQLGLIYSAALGIVTICSDIVDLARDRSSYGEDEPGPFSVREIFEQVHETVRPMAEEKGVTLQFSLPERVQCEGHPVLLSRVLLNLVTNALKFTEKGTVAVRAEEIERELFEFSVEDTGSGMDLRSMDDLFRAFKKSPGRSGHFFSGSGLGLSIARRLVSAMDSDLEVESRPGEGSRFSFRLKLPAASSF